MWRWWVGNARMLVLKLITRGLGWGLPEPVLPWEGVPPPPARGGSGPGGRHQAGVGRGSGKVQKKR